MAEVYQTNDRLFAGVDIGSLTAKSVIINGSGIISAEIINTGAEPRKAGETVLAKALSHINCSYKDVRNIVATGYGRTSLPFADKAVTEISCHAKGACYLNPDIEALIDIGGQDSKVIKLNSDGSISDFMMNDRCAAGTGRFLEIMASALEVDIDHFGRISTEASEPCKINSTCIVFAESEVISLLATGKTKNSIAAGLHQSIAKRIASMAKRLNISKKVVFTGGVAKNIGVKAALENYLELQFAAIYQDPQIIGALGAALLAKECCSYEQPWPGGHNKG